MPLFILLEGGRMKNSEYRVAWLAGLYYSQPNRETLKTLETQWGCTVITTPVKGKFTRIPREAVLIWRCESKKYTSRSLAKKALQHLTKEKYYCAFKTSCKFQDAQP